MPQGDTHYTQSGGKGQKPGVQRELLESRWVGGLAGRAWPMPVLWLEQLEAALGCTPWST